MARRRRKNGRSPRRSSVRVVTVTRTKGSGASQTTSYRAAGLSITGVGPTGRIASSRPTIRATVRDEGTNLSKRDIRLYLDGSEKIRFHYDRVSGRLSYRVRGALAPGTHRVEIEAEAESGDSQGRSNSTARKGWTFTVARR
ncbi:MAG TPA: hypothetical protein VEY13_00240 [Rubrobacteraceae bacterium]|nr:hypothetical protein [Rubrobacteraceae bacterium]